MRSILRIDLDGMPLLGTWHHPEALTQAPPPPSERRGAAGPGADRPARPGVLLLNAGQMPRAGVGDLMAQLADALAARGYPVARLDMPGLGDSPGDLPEHLTGLFRHIQTGGHVAAAAEALRCLRDRWNLPGWIVGGLCGGAITALHLTEVQPVPIRGLLLLEPDFALSDAASDARPAASERALLESRSRLGRVWRSGQAWRRFLTGRSDYRHHVQLLRYLLRRAGGRQRHEPPTDANRPLLERWCRARGSNLPVLVCTVDSALRRRLDEQYLGPDPHRPGGGFEWVELAGTNHLFLTGDGRAALLQQVTGWVQRCFPGGAPATPAAPTRAAKAGP